MLHNSITAQETTTVFLFLISITSVCLYWSYSSDNFLLHHCLSCFFGFFLYSRYNSRFSTLQAVISKPRTDINRYWSNLVVWVIVSEAYEINQQQTGHNGASSSFPYLGIGLRCGQISNILLVLQLNLKCPAKILFFSLSLSVCPPLSAQFANPAIERQYLK